MVTLSFDIPAKKITVDSPQTEITIQDLYDQAKDKEDDTGFIDSTIILTASGKESLGGGIQVGITLVMRNGWKLGFEARPGPTTVQCNVTGGNIIDESEIVGAQFFQTTFVQINYQSSASPTIAASNDTNIKYLLESARGTHGAYGTPIYWSPFDGNDLLTGESPENAVKTFAHAQTLVSAGVGDVIFILPNNPSAQTIITERITITVNNLRLRGSGTNIIFRPTTAGDTIVVTADDVELSGFIVENWVNAAVTDSCIVLNNAKRILVDNLVVPFSAGPGMKTLNSSNSTFKNLEISDTAKANFFVLDSDFIQLRNCYLHNSGVNNLHVKASSGNTTTNIVVDNCVFRNHTDFAIKIEDDSGAGTVKNISVNATCVFDSTGLGRDNYSTGSFDVIDVAKNLLQIHEVETGTWKIVGTQMIFFEQDGVTEIFRRDLKDINGDPSNTDVFEGVRV